MQNSISQPLLSSAEEKQQDEDEDQDCDNSEESAEEIQKPVTSIVSAYKLLTPSVKVWVSFDFIKFDLVSFALNKISIRKSYGRQIVC